MKYVDKALDYLADKVSDLREFAESFEEDLKNESLDNEVLPANQSDDNYIINLIKDEDKITKVI
jgi:predicted transcriptional regulator